MQPHITFLSRIPAKYILIFEKKHLCTHVNNNLITQKKWTLIIDSFSMICKYIVFI